MGPGLQVEADDTLDGETFLAYFKAFQEGLRRLEAKGESAVSVRIWKGRLTVVGSQKSGFIFHVISRPCPNCPPEDEED